MMNESFCPAYLMLYKEPGISSYLKGDATDIQTMIQNNNIAGAKALLEQYRAYENASIAALGAADREAYERFYFCLTTDITDPNKGPNYSFWNDTKALDIIHKLYSDRLSDGRRLCDSPGAVLAFASVASGFAAYVLDNYR
ncbi:MAG: hypothetical protein LBD54_02885 [Puniceicoccales bacterium]|nr:hypothetical protein [Puniceicoccales bacterium]